MIGIWRSYKSFYHNGHVKKHSDTSYNEIALTTDADLVLKSISKFTISRELKRADWEVQWLDKRRFLFIEGMKAYEIITFDAHDVVLVDAVTGEKVFYTSLAQWNERLEPLKKWDEEINVNDSSNMLVDRVEIVGDQSTIHSDLFGVLTF